MALDPRIRAELARRGPANVRELLRTRTGPGDRDLVALQLPGVPDPPRCREAEREGEAVTQDVLKWAKIAGRAAVIGVIVTAILGLAGLFVGIRSCSYSSSNYAEQHRPDVRNIGAPILIETPDPHIYIIQVNLQNHGPTAATGIMKIGAINSPTKTVTLLGNPIHFTSLKPDKLRSTQGTSNIIKDNLHDFIMLCIFLQRHTP
jgi:hypothetical protein